MNVCFIGMNPKTEESEGGGGARGTDTQQRLLEAAERLFASRGYAGLTVREVVREAEANVAAVNYHFDSKEGLVMEMLRRRVAPVNAERLDMLREAKTRAGGEPLQTEEIIEALLLPIGRAAVRKEGPDSTFMQLLGRSFTEPAEFLEKVHRDLFGELAEAFFRELARAYPEANPEELFWNLHFVVATMLGALAQHRRVTVLSGGRCDEDDVDGMIRRLITFATAGFSAGMEKRKEMRE